jgi:hypothetical protein
MGLRPLPRNQIFISQQSHWKSRQGRPGEENLEEKRGKPSETLRMIRATMGSVAFQVHSPNSSQSILMVSDICAGPWSLWPDEVLADTMIAYAASIPDGHPKGVIESLRPRDSSAAETAFLEQWNDLWAARSAVCANVFDTEPKHDAELPNRVSLRNALGPDQYDRAAEDYRALTDHLKDTYVKEREERSILGPLALWAPDMRTWTTKRASLLNKIRKQEPAGHESGKG